MDRAEFEKVLERAASERGCTVVGLVFDDDDNNFEVTLDKADGTVDILDCESVHRALLLAFDRNVEDYSLTVSSLGLTPEQADDILKTIEQ